MLVHCITIPMPSGFSTNSLFAHSLVTQQEMIMTHLLPFIVGSITLSSSEKSSPNEHGKDAP